MAVANFTLNRDHRTEVAARAFKWVVDLEFRADGLWKEFGHLLHNAHRYEEALDAYCRATEADPRDATAHGFCGHNFEHLNRAAEAEYRKGLEIDPIHPGLWSVLGRVLAGPLDRPAEAIEAFRKAIQFDPSDGEYC